MSETGYLIGAHRFRASPLAPGLYIVSTPIGNLGDITLRALEALAGADIIACEDTRVTGRLLQHFGIKHSGLVRYDDQSADQQRPRLLADLAQGRSIALVSDAGTPLVSDPGYKLVYEAREAGLDVFALPGASSVLAGLSSSGLSSHAFAFYGFFPAKADKRRKLLADLQPRQETLIFFERMSRMPQRLEEIEDIFGARPMAIGRELTKLYEEMLRGQAADIRAILARRDSLKGEAVLMIEGAREDDGLLFDSDQLLREALARGSLKDAVAEVADITGQARKFLYRRALELMQSS